MKVFSTLVLALTAAFGIYVLRRRIVLALKTGAIAYLVILPIRLLFSAGQVAAEVDQMIWPLIGVLVVWVVLWYVSTRYARRNQTRQPAPSPKPVRGARGR